MSVRDTIYDVIMTFTFYAKFRCGPGHNNMQTQQFRLKPGDDFRETSPRTQSHYAKVTFIKAFTNNQIKLYFGLIQI